MAKNIVTIGGGTGTFVVLSGLKKLPDVELSAIVSASDDGGSTGRLRDAHGILPVGDLRQALVALSPDEVSPTLRKLFTHRFSKGDIEGHNLGNLLITGLTEMLGDIGEAIEVSSNILRVEGRVIPVCRVPTTLVAELEDGTMLVGEHEIDECKKKRSKIKRISLKESEPVCASAVNAIQNADLIILGPGDLYTSTLANFVVPGVVDAIRKSKAKIVYVVNLFTKKGQTDNFTANHHVDEISRYVGKKPDYILMHKGEFPKKELKQYKKAEEFPIVDDLEGSEIVRDNFAIIAEDKATGDILHRSLIRHDSKKIAEVIKNL